MTDARLRLGIIGCGRISDRHLQVVAGLPALELVGVCDRVPARVQKASERAGVRGYADYLAMIEAEKPDMVTILTESGSHAEVGVACAPHVKALVIEKPMALTLDDADRLIEQCERHGTKLFVVKQNRYNRPVARLRAAMEAGRFGKLALGTVRVRWCRTQAYYDQDPWRGTWKDDGGVFSNQASHHLDLLQWMMGPIEAVTAYTATRLVDIETEDVGTAILRFTSGALGVIEATTATRPTDLEGSLSILGERGTVVIGGFAVNKIETWNFVEPTADDATIGEASVNPPNVYGFGHLEFYRDVIDCIVSERRSMLDGLEGRKSLEIINALYESAATRAEVRLRYVPRHSRLGR